MRTGKENHLCRNGIRKGGGRKGRSSAGDSPGPADPGASGTLYVVATPIGNLEDITLRAIRVLREVRLIAAEDTRRTRILLDAHRIATPMTSLHDWNESKKCGMLIEKIEAGEDIAYVSDAGTPGISDPGYILIREAVARNIRVAPVPGACALIAALSASGIPMDRFLFLGFLPSRSPARRRLLASLRQEERTLVFYESPRRLLAALEDIEAELGERQVVVSREITKLHEQFLRGSAGWLKAALQEGAVRGEVTLIVAGGSGDPEECSDAEILRLRDRLLHEGGLSRRDMAERIARETGTSRRRVYRLLLFS